MKANCDHKNPLQRDGVSQSDRMLDTLADDFAKVDGRTAKALMDYAYQYAQHVRFFEGENHKIAAGDWQSFFEALQGNDLKTIESQSNNEPHLALFLCFLHLMQYPQQALNRLPKRHLDFYYERVLQINKKKPVADTVHLIFELAKNATEQFVPKATTFDAQQDAKGNPRIYEAVEDVVLNAAKVAHLRSVLQKKDQLYFAGVANSADGLGEELPESAPAWSAFGHDQLPRAAVGFALASPILLLREGHRTITLTLQLSTAKSLSISTDDLTSFISFYASGEKAWLGPFKPNAESEATGDELKLTVKIPASEPAVVAYNPNVLSGEFNTLSPLVRVVLEPNLQSDLYHQLKQARLEEVKIEVDVQEVRNFAVENDLGLVNASKPFQPFGPVPKVGSSMYIGSDEIFQKELTSLKLNLKWQTPPDKLKDYYNGYDGYSVTSNSNFTAKAYTLEHGKWEEKSAMRLFKDNATEANTQEVFKNNVGLSGLLQLMLRPRLVMQMPYVRTIPPRSFVPVFERGLQRSVRPSFRVQRTQFKYLRDSGPRNLQVNRQRNGFLKLQLQKAFGHAQYPASYTVAIANTIEGVADVIPNEPYTPVLDSFHLDYKAATASVPFGKAAASSQKFEERQIQFFHLEPFGQAERHPFLHTQLVHVSRQTTQLLPAFSEKGHFYIGLEGAQPLQTISLLFQVLEGSADPDATKPAINWSVLADNHWMPLDSKHILTDYTNNFLTSGIIQFYLPAEANADNSLMEEGYIWLRATCNNPVEAASKMVAVHSQAIRARFVDKGNSLEHLETALAPGTIKKMGSRLPKIKKVEQPYASFGGKPEESDARYYRRVSERLRHKQRAITIWDYEHLILEYFPEVYKVKCLNHTSPTSERAPGHVTLVTIPNLAHQTMQPILQPKVKANTRDSILAFAKTHSSPFVQLHVQNPDYEQVKLSFKVAFRQNFEFGFYKRQLNQELIQFMTPWAFDQSTPLEFGGRIHKSTLINFMEQLPYVDYLEDVLMHHRIDETRRNTDLNEIKVSNSRAILISAAEHDIKPT